MHRVLCLMLMFSAVCAVGDALAVEADGPSSSEGLTVSGQIKLDVASTSELNRQLAAWLVQSFETAGLTVRAEPQGVWGLGTSQPALWRAVIAAKTKRGDAWQVDVALVRSGLEGAEATARFRVVEMVPVWVVTESFRKGGAISCAHLRRETRPVGVGRGHWQGACTDLSALRMRRSLMPGDVLKHEDLGGAYAVQTQRETTVLTRAGVIEVRTTGVALADAEIGARVPVRLQGQTQVIQAVVIGPGMAQVDEGM